MYHIGYNAKIKVQPHLKFVFVMWKICGREYVHKTIYTANVIQK